MIFLVLLYNHVVYSAGEEKKISQNELLAYKYVKKGNTFLDSHDYDKALASFEISLNIFKSTQANVGKGNALFAQGKYGDAVKAYDDALQTQQNNSNIHFLKGIALFAQGKYNDALGSYDLAIKNDPTNSTIYFLKGRTLLELQKPYDAFLEFNKASVIDNKSDYLFYEAGILFRDLNKTEEALDAYNKAIKLDPQNVNLYLGKGTVLFAQGKYQSALDAYVTGMRLRAQPDKNDSIILITKGTELQEKKNLTMSLAYLNQALTLDQKNINLYLIIGDVLFAQGKYQSALDAYVTGMRLRAQPDKNDSIILITKGTELQKTNGTELQKTNNLTISLSYFRFASELDQNNTDAYYGKGITLFRLGQFKEALDAFDKSLEKDTNNVYAQFGRGHSLFELSLYSDALRAFDNSLSINSDLKPYIVESLTEKGIRLIKMNNLTMSLVYLNESLKLDPENVNAYLAKGNALFAQGKYGDATSSYDKAISLDVNNSTLHFSKGIALFKQGIFDKALQSFQEALNKNPSKEEREKIIDFINKTTQLINSTKTNLVLSQSKKA